MLKKVWVCLFISFTNAILKATCRLRLEEINVCIVRGTLRQPFNTPHLSGCSTLQLERDLSAPVPLCIVVGVLIIRIQASSLTTCSFVLVEKCPLGANFAQHFSCGCTCVLYVDLGLCIGPYCIINGCKSSQSASTLLLQWRNSDMHHLWLPELRFFFYFTLSQRSKPLCSPPTAAVPLI